MFRSLRRFASINKLETPRFDTLPCLGFQPITLWSEGVWRCVLRRADGDFELLLYQKGRVTRLETCNDEYSARARAHKWLIAQETLPRA